MANIRYELNLYTSRDRADIRRHLERMAQKGWRLEKAGGWLWKYRRAAPQRLHYEVTFFPEASSLDPEPSQAQVAYWELCQEAGWELVAAIDCMQIFCNDREDPTPIETEPAVQVAGIHQVFVHTRLWTELIPLMYAILFGFRFAQQLEWLPLSLLSNSTSLILGLTLGLAGLLQVISLLAYAIWYRRAKKAAQNGAFLQENGTYARSVWQFIILILGVLAAGIAELRADSSELIIVLVSMTGLVVIMLATQWTMKKRGVASDLNKRITGFIAGALAVVLFVLVPILQQQMDPTDGPEDMLLTIEELAPGTTKTYVYHADHRESVFAAQHSGQQQAGWWSDSWTDQPELFYTVTKVKAPWMYDFFYEKWTQMPTGEPTDAQVWNALEAEKIGSYYYLVYPDRFATIRFGWEPTQEQIDAAVEVFLDF